MNTPATLRLRLLQSGWLCSLLAGTSAIHAQETASAATAPAEDETVILAPFEVVTDQDTGYVAQNTAAGSRLNASLKDTPAPISVFTSEFIADIGATDLGSLSEYMMNTDRDVGFVRDTPQGNNFATNDITFRIRGLTTDLSGGRAVDFFKRTIEVDMFNVERVEFSRGPNAILFGQGNLAGTLNTQSKKADVLKPRYEATLRGGSSDAFRAHVDINAPIVKGKVALRVNVLTDRKDSWRPNEFKDADRLALAGRIQFTPRTTLDVGYEKARVDQSIHRGWVAFDNITSWIALGRLVDPVAGTPFPANAGLVNTSTAVWFAHNSATGAIYNMRNQSQPAIIGPTTALRDRKMLYEFDLVPREATIGGPGVGSDIDADIFSAFFRHELLPKLHVELAFNRQDSSYLGRDINQNDFTILYDTNAQLPGGAANPNVGRPYVEAVWFNRNRVENHDDLRLTTSYELNLGRVFGSHRFAGLFERRDEETQFTPLVEHVIQNPANTVNPENNANRLHRRTYVDLTGPVAAIALDDYRRTPVNGLTNLSTGQPITSAFLPLAGVRDDRFVNETAMLVAQSTFWENRVVTTLGYREDRADFYRSTSVRGPAFAPFTNGTFMAVRPTTPEKHKGSTRSQGVVFHATNWLSLFYNRSNSFLIPEPQTMLPNDPLPAPRGESEDLGLKFSLWEGKVFATVSYYQSAARNDSENLNTGTITNPVNSIWTTLDDAGVLAANGLALDEQTINATGYVFDSDAQGWEVELVANPMSNWRVSFSVSDNKTINTNIAREVRDYVAEWHDFFLAGTRGRLIIDGDGALAPNAIDPSDGTNNTVAERLLGIDQSIEGDFVRNEGVRVMGFPRYSANLRTNYTFTSGPLKGLGLGGGGRWREAPIAGYTSTDPATRQELEGSSTLLCDGNASYRRKLPLFGKDRDWSIQLNVNNLFNDEDIIVGRVYNDGSIRTYSFQTPREWFVTTTVRF